MTIQYLLVEGHNSKVPPLSLAAAADGFLFISGTPGYDDKFELSEVFAEQLQTAFSRVSKVLARAGVTPRDIVKTNVYLTRAGDVPEMNRQYAEFFGRAPYPARTTCIVAALPDPKMLVEIECIATLTRRIEPPSEDLAGSRSPST